MKKDKIGMEKVETYLEQCRYVLSQLKNSKNLTESEITTRYGLMEYLLDKMDEELGISSKKSFEGFIGRLGIFDNLVEKNKS